MYQETLAIVVDLNGSGSAVVVDSRSSNVPERWCQEARNGGLGSQEFLVVHVCVLGNLGIEKVKDKKGKEHERTSALMTSFKIDQA